MSKEEIKNEINTVLDKFSNEALVELLSYLKRLEPLRNTDSVNSDALRRILSEDRELLAKLAQ